MTLRSPIRSPLSAAVRSAFDPVRRGGSPALTEQVQAIFAKYPTATGAMYDFLSAATLFQDSAATTPVTATGQPIGYAEDLSGQGKHFVQATAAARPIWNSLADFDGVNHWAVMDLTGAAMANGPITLGVRMTYIGGTSFAGVLAAGSSPNATAARVYSRAGMSYGNGNVVETPAASTTGLHTTIVQTGGGTANGLAVIDDVDTVLANPGAGSGQTMARYLVLGCQTTIGGNRANIDVSRVFLINAALTPTERATVSEWLGKPI